MILNSFVPKKCAGLLHASKDVPLPRIHLRSGLFPFFKTTKYSIVFPNFILLPMPKPGYVSPVLSMLCFFNQPRSGEVYFPHSPISKQEKLKEYPTWENLIMKMTKWHVEEAKRNWVLGKVEWLSQACREPTLYLGFQFHQPTNALYRLSLFVLGFPSLATQRTLSDAAKINSILSESSRFS